MDSKFDNLSSSSPLYCLSVFHRFLWYLSSSLTESYFLATQMRQPHIPLLLLFAQATLDPWVAWDCSFTAGKLVWLFLIEINLPCKTGMLFGLISRNSRRYFEGFDSISNSLSKRRTGRNLDLFYESKSIIKVL